jgi:hypothetical protein
MRPSRHEGNDARYSSHEPNEAAKTTFIVKFGITFGQ